MLEESQSKIQGQLSGVQRVNNIMEDVEMSVGNNLFTSGLGRGPRLHIDALSGSPQMNKADKPTEPPGYFGHQQHDHELLRSRLERLYASAVNDQQAAPPVYHHHMDDARRSAQHMEQL